MNKDDAWELFFIQMLNNATTRFRATEQHLLLREKIKHMEDDCQSMFNQDQQHFAKECFDLLLDASGQQEFYVYRQGWHDCVAMLKELRVLA